jgi:hypothetical protein
MQTDNIIIRVRGGVGNQLFIYAFARSLSLNLGRAVILETRTGFLRDSYKRKYCLDKFNINLKSCPWYLACYYPLRHRFATITKMIYGNVTFIDEIEFNNNPELAISKIQMSKCTFMDGYWQDSSYFADYEDIIKSDLSLRVKPGVRNLRIAHEIKECNSVAVHLRRVKYDKLLELDYYYKAVNQMKARMENPVFYIFSDNINWCKQNFINDESFIYVDSRPPNEITDIWLMSQCKHFIIANSTFSWWGAWLSDNPGKIILMPDTIKVD